MGSQNENTTRFRLSAYVGPNWSNVSPSGINLVNETDTFNSLTHPTDVTWGFGAAYRWLSPNTYFFNLHDVSLGMDFVYFQTKQQGMIWQYNDPTFANYNYNLPITSWRFMVNSEETFQALPLRFPHQTEIYPFINVGIGGASNEMSYNDTPIPAIGGLGLKVGSYTQSQFAWDAGAGLKVPFSFRSRTFEASVRYLYTDLGQATTSSQGNITLTAPITTHLSTQTLLFGLSVLL